MHEYRSPALKRLNCLLSEMDAAYHEAAQRQGQNDSTSRILYALCELGSPAPLRAERGITSPKRTRSAAVSTFRFQMKGRIPCSSRNVRTSPA